MPSNFGEQVTISGGAVYDNSQAGIYAHYDDATVEGLQVHGNGQGRIDATAYSSANPVNVTDDTVYANADYGINSSAATVSDNVVYDQVSTNYDGILNNGGQPVSDNTIYGSSTGLADTGGVIQGNLLYDNSGDGLFLSPGFTYTAIGNIAYGDKVGIGGGGNSTRIEDNLVYNNVTTGIAITSGTTLSIVNNTVYQSVGQALTLSGASAVTVEKQHSVG